MVVKAESTAYSGSLRFEDLIETDEPLCVDPRPSYLNPDGPRGHRLPAPGLARRPQAASVRGFHFHTITGINGVREARPAVLLSLLGRLHRHDRSSGRCPSAYWS